MTRSGCLGGSLSAGISRVAAKPAASRSALEWEPVVLHPVGENPTLIADGQVIPCRDPKARAWGKEREGGGPQAQTRLGLRLEEVPNQKSF